MEQEGRRRRVETVQLAPKRCPDVIKCEAYGVDYHLSPVPHGFTPSSVQNLNISLKI